MVVVGVDIILWTRRRTWGVVVSRSFILLLTQSGPSNAMRNFSKLLKELIASRQWMIHMLEQGLFGFAFFATHRASGHRSTQQERYALRERDVGKRRLTRNVWFTRLSSTSFLCLVRQTSALELLHLLKTVFLLNQIHILRLELS